MLEAITLGQILGWIGAAGAAGLPLVIMTIMWWFELQERKRLQGVVEGFLPTARSIARSNRALTKVVAPDAEDEDSA